MTLDWKTDKSFRSFIAFVMFTAALRELAMAVIALRSGTEVSPLDLLKRMSVIFPGCVRGHNPPNCLIELLPRSGPPDLAQSLAV